jgi:Outer membrane receptor proteins, mostly Fe transport
MRGPRKKDGTRHGQTCRIATILLLSTALAGPVAILPVMAQDVAAQQSYAIPAQPLSRALVQFSRISGLQVFVDDRITEGLQSPAVNGPLSARAALTRLLSGTGLSYRFTNANTVSITGGATGQAGSADLPVDGIMLDPITVHGGFSSEATYSEPGATFTVDGEMLGRVAPSSTGDILDGVPGVIAGNNHSTMSVDPNIRGAQGMGRVSLTVDGMENSSSVYKGYGGTSTQFYLDPDFIAGYEVNKSTAMTGGSAIGGRIAMATYSADDLIKEGKAWGIRTRLSFGQADGDGSRFDSCDGTDTAPDYCLGEAHRRAYAAFDPAYREGVPGHDYAASLLAGWQPNDRLAFTFGYARRENGNYETGSNGEIPRTYYYADGSYMYGYDDLTIFHPDSEAFGTFSKTESYLVKSEIDLGYDQTLELKYSKYDSWYGSFRATNYEIARYTPYYAPSTTDQETYGLHWNWVPQDSLLIDLSVDVWRGTIDEYRAAIGQDSETETTGIRVENTSRFDLFSRSSSLTFGAQFMRDRVTASGGGSDGSRDVTGSTRETTGLYANLNTDITPWLSAQAGVRHDRYELERDPSSTLGTNASSVMNSDGSGNSYNFALTASLPWQGAQAFASFADGWRAPTAREELLRNSNADGAAIRPEKLRSWEIGLTYSGSDLWRSGDFLGAKISYFDKEYTDYISGNGYFPGFANMPSLTYRGIELALNYDMGRVYTEYSLTHYTKAELCGSPLSPSRNDIVGCHPGFSGGINDAYGIPSAPEFMHVLTLGARFMQEKLDLGVRYTKVTESAFDTAYWMNGEPYNYVEYINVPYSTVDLFGSYEVNETFSIDFSVENVTDQYYLDIGSGYANAVPAPGRTFRVGLTTTF